jgi:hypothetical protein
VKVIEQKEIPKIFPMRITCEPVKYRNRRYLWDPTGYCGSTLEIEEDDIILVRLEHPVTDVITYVWIVICPVCKRVTILDERLIPDKVKRSCKFIDLIKKQ